MGWLAVLAAVRGRIAVEPQRLVQYRQHAGQLTQMSLLAHTGPGPATLDRNEQLRWDQARVHLVADRVRRMTESNGTGGPAADLFRRDGFLSDRLEMRGAQRARRGSRVLRHVVDGNYARYTRGLRTALRDLVAPPEH